MPKKRTKKRLEFSKLVVILIMIIAVSSLIVSNILMFVTQDASALAYQIPSAFGLLATTAAFYYNKSKAENKLKILKGNKKLTVEEVNSLYEKEDI